MTEVRASDPTSRCSLTDNGLVLLVGNGLPTPVRDIMLWPVHDAPEHFLMSWFVEGVYSVSLVHRMHWWAPVTWVVTVKRVLSGLLWFSCAEYPASRTTA